MAAEPTLPGDWVIFATSMGFKSENRKYRTDKTQHKICYADFKLFKETF